MDLEQAIKYLSDKSEPTNKIHWWLIIMGVFWHLTAVITTWYVLTKPGRIYIERNPLAATAFEYLGMVPTFMIMFVVVIIAMVYIPYKFRNNKVMGILCNTVFVIFFILDGGHNAAVLAGNNIILDIPYEITENIMMYLGV